MGIESGIVFISDLDGIGGSWSWELFFVLFGVRICFWGFLEGFFCWEIVGIVDGMILKLIVLYWF